MREILFRGKCGYNNEWVEGFYYQAKLYRSDKELCHYITIPHPESDGQPSDHIMVNPETIGQFTALTDKNGKKIFEGDILSTENGTFSNTGMGHILFYKGMWTSFYGQDAIGRDCYDELHTVCRAREVIGNIHDNPELLEVQQ